jgi:uncharacterized protein (DUF433 family)
MAKHADRIDSTLMDVPHVVGRRISVIQLYRQITEGKRAYDELAEDLNLDPGDIHAAVEYYEANREEMEILTERMKREKTALREQIAENRPDGVSPP